jgi:hypothetical protein
MTKPNGLVEVARQIEARKTKGERKPKALKVEPTAERAAMNEMRSAGMAATVVPVIDTLLKREQITQDEHAKLLKYRQVAIMADGSETRDSCDFSVRGGNGYGPSAAVISARIDTALYENRAGVHAGLLRAVARDDTSLTRYCVERFGGRERVKDGIVEIRPIGNSVKRALGDLQTAAALILPEK